MISTIVEEEKRKLKMEKALRKTLEKQGNFLAGN